VRVFRLLVSHEDVPAWSDQPISSVGFRRDLYTGVEAGDEVDRFEDWITREFEEPAIPAVKRAIDGDSLNQGDFRRLAMFFALQDVRTPSAFIEFLDRWKEELPELIDKTIRESVAGLEAAAREGKPIPSPEKSGQDFSQPIQVTTSSRGAEDETHGVLQASVLLGRGLWLNSMQRLLSGVANHLAEHHWSIVEPIGSSEWFTSDHPALKLNYYEEGRYDFGGGWGKKGSELMLPLSPRHLLYTKVGSTADRRFVMPRWETFQIQRFLAERAHREIIARQDERRVSWFVTRVVDPEIFRDEQAQWAAFHSGQVEVEEPGDNNNPA
jgi:hypothetical protein